jgi:hypothetical protein
MRTFTKIDEWELWVPPVDGERELYETDPDEAVTMELRFLTKEQRDYYQRAAERYKRNGRTHSADEKAARQLLDENVRNIKNYGEEGNLVKTGAELFDFDGDNEIAVAVTTALFDRSSLEKGLAKKLRSRSDSCASIRGCDEETEEITHDWMPSLKRCPKSQMTEEVWQWLQWWIDWKKLGCLPWPGSEIAAQPAFVYDLLMLCESEHSQMMAEVESKTSNQIAQGMPKDGRGRPYSIGQ